MRRPRSAAVECWGTASILGARRTELERRLHYGHHWWTLAELAGTTETVYPYRLAELLADIIAGRIPTAPVELPWHHQ